MEHTTDRTRKARSAEDERNRILMERTGLCVFDYDVKADTLEYNVNFPNREKEFKTIVGYLSRLPELTAIHPDSRELIARMLEEASAKVMTGTFEYMADYFDWGYHWYRVYFVSVADETGSVYRVVGQYNDVQAEKERDAMLRSLNARLNIRTSAPSCNPVMTERVFQLLYESDDVDSAIRAVLEAIGVFYNVSRVYVFEEDDDRAACSNTFEWCAEGVEPWITAMQRVPYAESGGGTCRERYDASGVFLLKDVSALPERQRAFFDLRRARSLLHCAIKNRGAFSGYIGFDECRRNRTWTKEQTDTLLLVSRMLGSFIVKKREQDKAAFSQDFRAALDNYASYVYIVDPATFEIIYTNEALRSELPAGCEGSVCYREFMGQNEQCANCPARVLTVTGASHAVELRRPDGRWMLSEASPMHWNGRDMMMITCTDITEHKRASEELAVRNAENEIVVRQSGKNVLRYNLGTGCFERYYDAQIVFGHGGEVARTPEDSVRLSQVAPECAEGYLDFFSRMRALEPTGSTDQKLLCGAGDYRWFHGDYTLMNGPDGKPAYAIISTYDNNDAMEKSLRYQKWQENLAALLRDNAMYLESNLTRNTIEREENLGPENAGRAENSLTAYVEYGREHITYPEDIPAFCEFFDRERLMGLFEAGTAVDQMDYRAIIGGRPQWYRVNVQMTRYPYSDDVKAIFIYACIDRERSALTRLADETQRDPMTRLYRREAAAQAITERLLAARDGERVALFMIDLDNFRQINDRLGHQQGDETLLHAAGAVADTFCSTDVTARIEGDEFLVFMSGDAAREVTERKANALIDALRLDAGGIMLTASVGVATGFTGETNYDQLYRVADSALYEAKRSGRNRYALLDTGAPERQG